jgi:hypothetical protein
MARSVQGLERGFVGRPRASSTSRSWSHESQKPRSTITVQSIGPYGSRTSNLRSAASRARARVSTSSLVATKRVRVAPGDSPAEPPSGRLRPDVLLELGFAESYAGDPQAAGHLQAALEIAPATTAQVAITLALGRMLQIERVRHAGGGGRKRERAGGRRRAARAPRTGRSAEAAARSGRPAPVLLPRLQRTRVRGTLRGGSAAVKRSAGGCPPAWFAAARARALVLPRLRILTPRARRGAPTPPSPTSRSAHEPKRKHSRPRRSRSPRPSTASARDKWRRTRTSYLRTRPQRVR